MRMPIHLLRFSAVFELDDCLLQRRKLKIHMYTCTTWKTCNTTLKIMEKTQSDTCLETEFNIHI